MPELTREILLSLWKIHILHHAAEHPIYGQWVIEELRRHGYEISPGTLYPLLRRMERLGWLEPLKSGTAESSKARREYALTGRGAEILAMLRENVEELHRELKEEPREKRARKTRKRADATPS